MDLQKFALDLFEKVKDWIEPAVKKLREDIDTVQKRQETSATLLLQRIDELEESIPASFDAKAFADELIAEIDKSYSGGPTHDDVAEKVLKSCNILEGQIRDVQGIAEAAKAAIDAISIPNVSGFATKAELSESADETMQLIAAKVAEESDRLNGKITEVEGIAKSVTAAIEAVEIPDVSKFISETEHRHEVTETTLLISDLKKSLSELSLRVDQIKAIPAPKNGRPGDDGEDGRDGLDIEILPGIDMDKSYPRGTYAHHLGGLWRAHTRTDKMRGWDCIVKGICEINIDQIDQRNISVSVQDSCDTITKKAFSIPAMVYRGVWREDDYQAGDCVTWGGSLWHCDKPTDAKPGNKDSGWTLCVKKGRDGS